MSNIPNDPYTGGIPMVPLKVTQTPDGYEVTSTHYPGKVWKGPDEQTAIRAQQVEVKELHGKRETHLHQAKAKWMIEEEAKKADKSLRIPDKFKNPA